MVAREARPKKGPHDHVVQQLHVMKGWDGLELIKAEVVEVHQDNNRGQLRIAVQLREAGHYTECLTLDAVALLREPRVAADEMRVMPGVGIIASASHHAEAVVARLVKFDKAALYGCELDGALTVHLACDGGRAGLHRRGVIKVGLCKHGEYGATTTEAKKKKKRV